jgi:hypothetical protein
MEQQRRGDGQGEDAKAVQPIPAFVLLARIGQRCDC